LIKNEKITTPPASIGILQGITRDTVIELAVALGYEVTEPLVTLYDVYNADEIFLTGTAAEVIPAVTVDGRAIGSGQPGPVTRQLMSSFSDYARSTGVPVE